MKSRRFGHYGAPRALRTIYSFDMTRDADRFDKLACDLNLPKINLGIRIPRALHVLEMNLRLDLERLEFFANGHPFGFGRP